MTECIQSRFDFQGPGDVDGAAGLVKHLARIVARIRRARPDVSILVRGDSGFCRDRILAWCEENHVDYVAGSAKNSRLIRILGKESHEAEEMFEQTREPARVFKDFTCRTRKSWSRERRVVGKGEHLAKGANPRFVATSPEAFGARTVYEDLYCARGEMKNRIKEQQLCLFADRTSRRTMRANQLRLAFSTVAYVLLRALRAFGLGETKMSHARVDTIRLRVLKIGAAAKATVRKIWVAMSESRPWQETFAAAYRALTAWRSPAAVPAQPNDTSSPHFNEQSAFTEGTLRAAGGILAEIEPQMPSSKPHSPLRQPPLNTNAHPPTEKTKPQDRLARNAG